MPSRRIRLMALLLAAVLLLPGASAPLSARPMAWRSPAP